MKQNQLKATRALIRVSGATLGKKARISNSVLSQIERGTREWTLSEKHRLETALGLLKIAKEKVKAFADEVGWPME